MFILIPIRAWQHTKKKSLRVCETFLICFKCEKCVMCVKCAKCVMCVKSENRVKSVKIVKSIKSVKGVTCITTALNGLSLPGPWLELSIISEDVFTIITASSC